MLRLDPDQTDFRKQLEKFCATAGRQPDIERAVAEIIADVQAHGDTAVLRYTAKFDNAHLSADGLRVQQRELNKAESTLPAALRKALKVAAKNIRAFHKRTVPKSWETLNPQGARVGERFHPLRRCGLYIPGGQVPLVSTVLMTAIPAQLAGVPEIVACTPPRADGSVSPELLAALNFCGVSEVYRVGGVQAIAALAHGTESIPAVDKVFGPGNAYVCEAKRQIYGTVGVDLLPGPSEVMVIADTTARPEWVAAGLLAQAEHGTGKEKVYLLTADAPLVEKVAAAIKEQLATLPRAEKIRACLADGFCVITAAGREQIVEIANSIAPEHLELHVASPEISFYEQQITTAGAVFSGHWSPTVLGDFVAGPSHTLPTGRTGRFFSGLQVSDFMRRSSIVEYSPESLRKAAPTVAAFSQMEQLAAHGRSLSIRLD
jgi:histidinol dehydrogenase